MVAGLLPHPLFLSYQFAMLFRYTGNKKDDLLSIHLLLFFCIILSKTKRGNIYSKLSLFRIGHKQVVVKTVHINPVCYASPYILRFIGPFKNECNSCSSKFYSPL